LSCTGAVGETAASNSHSGRSSWFRFVLSTLVRTGSGQSQHRSQRHSRASSSATDLRVFPAWAGPTFATLSSAWVSPAGLRIGRSTAEDRCASAIRPPGTSRVMPITRKSPSQVITETAVVGGRFRERTVSRHKIELSIANPVPQREGKVTQLDSRRA
jgi:hypothetical protein